MTDRLFSSMQTSVLPCQDDKHIFTQVMGLMLQKSKWLKWVWFNTYNEGTQTECVKRTYHPCPLIVFIGSGHPPKLNQQRDNRNIAKRCIFFMRSYAGWSQWNRGKKCWSCYLITDEKNGSCSCNCCRLNHMSFGQIWKCWITWQRTSVV